MYSPLHDPASTEKKHKHKKKKKKKKAEKEKRKHAEAAIQVMSDNLRYMCYCVQGYFCHVIFHHFAQTYIWPNLFEICSRIVKRKLCPVLNQATNNGNERGENMTVENNSQYAVYLFCRYTKNF